MSDIVERLHAPNCAKRDRLKAADEIERLQIELKAAQTGIGALQETVDRLRAALQAIANYNSQGNLTAIMFCTYARRALEGK